MRTPKIILLTSGAVLCTIFLSIWLLYGAQYPTKTYVVDTEVARRCSLIETGEYITENIPLPITCSMRIYNNEAADFTFQADGGLLIQRDGEIVLKLTSDDGSPEGGHFSELSYFDEPRLRADGFILKDVTFDGYADIQVMTFAGAYNFGHDFYAYNPQTHTFGPEPILKDLVNVSVDLEHKEIVYFHKGRGLADTFSSGTYRFIDGVYVLVETVTQDMMTGYDDPNPLYERITSKLQNGIMVVTKKETLTYTDVWGDE